MKILSFLGCCLVFYFLMPISFAAQALPLPKTLSDACNGTIGAIFKQNGLDSFVNPTNVDLQKPISHHPPTVAYFITDPKSTHFEDPKLDPMMSTHEAGILSQEQYGWLTQETKGCQSLAATIDKKGNSTHGRISEKNPFIKCTVSWADLKTIKVHCEGCRFRERATLAGQVVDGNEADYIRDWRSSRLHPTVGGGNDQLIYQSGVDYLIHVSNKSCNVQAVKPELTYSDATGDQVGFLKDVNPKDCDTIEYLNEHRKPDTGQRFWTAMADYCHRYKSEMARAAKQIEEERASSPDVAAKMDRVGQPRGRLLLKDQ